MNCPRCDAQNLADARDCAACGAPLVVACRACGSSNPARQKFCGDCGMPLGRSAGRASFVSPGHYTPKHLAEKILMSRASLEGERKQVTVLFADIKGSLELLDDRDPEDARRLLDAVLERMMQAVHQYEGTVNQVMGDGIMAIFGAPLAHEDHAVRACYAALRMQDSIARYSAEMRQTEGIAIQLRIGLNSGEVVVRSISTDLRMDYSAIGQTTHLAARMEQIAAPGSIVMTSDSLRLAEGYVEVKALGAVPVKGLAKPIDVFEVTGAGSVRSRLQAAAARGFTRFVGRDAEIAQLRHALQLAGAAVGQVVAVAGEAGVGKSRLIHEFIHSRHSADWLVLESQTASFGHATPYLPLIGLLSNYFLTNARDTTRTIREKVTGKILTLDSSLADASAPILDLLDAIPDAHPFRSLDPQQRRQATVQAIIRLLVAESRIQPVIVVFEDLHWNDSLTLGMLNELVDRVPEARLLLLVSYRPEHQDDWKDRPYYRHLRLEPLQRESLEELMQVLLGVDPSLDALKVQLMARGGGNPFFVEEIVRTMIETRVIDGARGAYRLARPVSSMQVPVTVQAVLASRIDRLPVTEKHLLQEAAVIGNDVPFALLQEISGRADDELRGLLAELQTAEFIYATRLYPDLQYTFKHSLTHEVAYSGLLLERRQEIHARIVAAMEKLYVGRLGEQIERLAHHALSGQLWGKALPYLRQAGAKAAERQAYRAAAALFEQALGVLEQLPGTRGALEQAVDLRLDLRNVLQPLGDHDRIGERLREAERCATQLDDARRIGWIQSYFTDHHWMLGRTQEAVAAGARALAAARALSDLPLQVVTNLPMGLVYHTMGDYPDAIEYFAWNVENLQGDLLNERFGLFVLPSSFARSFLAWCYAELGRFTEAIATSEQGVRIAEAANHPFSRGYAHLGRGVVRLRKGNLTAAIEAFECALAEGAFEDVPVGFAYVAFHLGYALALSGQLDKGVSLLEKTVELAEAKHFVARHSLRLAYLGEAYALAGRTGAAATVAERALQLAREHRERANEAYVLRVLGEVAARAGKAKPAEAHLRAALASAEALGMRPLQANCHWGLADVLEQCAQHADAASHRESAAALSRGMELRRWSERLDRERSYSDSAST
jgi:class 3 adenylate cyclase/tetratricopeptide (TPR) repeat protein